LLSRDSRTSRQHLAFQIHCDFGELGEGGLEVFDNFGGDDVRAGEVGSNERMP
jgi:hypothetical protein